MNWAVKNNLIENHPFSNAVLKKKASIDKERPALSDEEITKLLENLPVDQESLSWCIQCIEDPCGIPALMEKKSFDVILLDMNFTQDATSGKEGLHWLGEILRIDPLAVVILIKAYGDIQTAVHAIHLGASDFILKPWENERMIATTSTALNLSESRTEVNRLQTQQKQLNEDMDSRFHELIGTSPGMPKVFPSSKKSLAQK